MLARADKAALDKRSQRLLACLSPRGLKPKVESKKAQEPMEEPMEEPIVAPPVVVGAAGIDHL
jgi:hypothetical protein